jgi:hypothetical protein
MCSGGGGGGVCNTDWYPKANMQLLETATEAHRLDLQSVLYQNKIPFLIHKFKKLVSKDTHIIPGILLKYLGVLKAHITLIS